MATSKKRAEKEARVDERERQPIENIERNLKVVMNGFEIVVCSKAENQTFSSQIQVTAAYQSPMMSASCSTAYASVSFASVSILQVLYDENSHWVVAHQQVRLAGGFAQSHLGHAK